MAAPYGKRKNLSAGKIPHISSLEDPSLRQQAALAVRLKGPSQPKGELLKKMHDSDLVPHYISTKRTNTVPRLLMLFRSDPTDPPKKKLIREERLFPHDFGALDPARKHQPTVGYGEKRSIKPRPGEKNRSAQVSVKAEGHDDHHITWVSLHHIFP